MAEQNGRGSTIANTLIGVLTLVSSALTWWVTRMDDQTRNLQDQVIELREDGAELKERVHGILEALARHRIQITDLDQTLQREMRILDDSAATRVTEIDRRIQQEMKIREDTILEKIRALERNVYGKEGQ